jgi:hypothetical protein
MAFLGNTSKIAQGVAVLNIKEMVSKQEGLIINSRRDLHRIPEPAWRIVP